MFRSSNVGDRIPNQSHYKILLSWVYLQVLLGCYDFLQNDCMVGCEVFKVS